MLKKILFFTFLWLWACITLAAEVPLKGFSHDNKQDIFGYYQPVQSIKVGKFNLSSLNLGSPWEMKEYESGNKQLPTYAPVMFVFEDITSEKQTNEMGGESYQNMPRILPTAYRIKGNTISFIGTDKQVGDVSFNGTIDLHTLLTEQTKNSGYTDKVIVKGDLTINGKMFKDVTFTWFAGD